jgi:HEAT repeat protein
VPVRRSKDKHARALPTPIAPARPSAIARTLGTAGLALALCTAGTAVHASLWPDVPDRLAADLVSPDVARRRAAAVDIALVPTADALRFLKIALVDPDLDVRLAGAGAAEKRGVLEIADLVVPWLTDPDARLREGACTYFAEVPQARYVKVIARALGDADSKVRLAAVRALGASGSTEAVAPLLARLDDANSKVRLAVARALGKLGDKRAVTPLVSKVQDEAAEVRQAVVRALGDLGDARAAPALVIALRDPAIEVEIEALASLGRLRAGDAVPSIAPLAIETAKKGSSENVRRAALGALGRIATPGAVEAIVKTFGLFEDAGAGVRTSPARDAAVSAGTTAVPALLAVLREGSGASTSAAASAAYALGQLRAPGAGDAIARAIRRGDVPLTVGLFALGAVGDATQLPICLEQVAAPDRSIREQALKAAARLLDPEHPDGRAVEPLLASLELAQTPEDRAEIAALLGRTGADRVAKVLVGLTASKDERLRIAAVEALGTLRATSGGPALAKLLDDPSATVRFRAAVALARAGGPDVTPVVLGKLASSVEADRLAIAIAIGGLLERNATPAMIETAKKLAISGVGPERDLIVVAIGRAKGEASIAALKEIAAGAGADADTRRAVALALGAHGVDPGATPLLATLAADSDPSVRAQAAWSLGAAGAPGASKLVEKLVDDGAMSVAANALGALARIALRAPAAPAPPAICKALTDDRPYVRANALGGLALLARGARPATCGDGSLARRSLGEDTNEAVRTASARLGGAIVATSAADAPPWRAALERCVLADPSGAVAGSCRDALRPPPGVDASTQALVVFIAPDDGGAPVARGAYAIERPDGLLHTGNADRRGAVVELDLPRGVVRLRVAVPAAGGALKR